MNLKIPKNMIEDVLKAAKVPRKKGVRLSDSQKTEIRQRFDNGETQASLATEFNVSAPTISNIIRHYKTLNPRKSQTTIPVQLSDSENSLSNRNSEKKVFVG